MASKRKRVNPFYILLLVAGVAFTLTACVYGVAMVRQLHAGRMGIDPAGQPPLIQWIDRHGGMLLLGELIVLAVATVAAIGSDRFWSDEG